MIVLGILLVVLAGIAGFYVWKYRREIEYARARLGELFTAHQDMYQAVAMGLYHRFNREEDKEETPHHFEHFVKEVMEDYYGGLAVVTPYGGDFGVDIIHKRHNGLYLGQVKCYNQDQPVDFEPIAIIHSRMIKDHAQGGFVVTTSSFSEDARQYANELGINIELIDGTALVKHWVEATENKKQTYPLAAAVN
ncbi:MAG: hypothetical protein JWN30_970 [Bacilli bacterium]|nr:hypothetical protein [Bacilli bacterium]